MEFVERGKTRPIETSPIASSRAPTPHKVPSARQTQLSCRQDGATCYVSELFPRISSRIAQATVSSNGFLDTEKTPESLLQYMLITIFGWSQDVYSLLKDEYSQHDLPLSSRIILSRWLQDNAEIMLEKMKLTSTPIDVSDWMMLALASAGSQKKAGQIFVERLLDQGHIHPAVAMLLELGESSDAIEVYVSRKMWMEAVLLTALTSPGDWQRIRFLVKKWGLTEAIKGNEVLANRCRQCAKTQPSVTWISPPVRDALSIPHEPSASTRERFGRFSPGFLAMKATRPDLRLVTKFGTEQLGKHSSEKITAIPASPHARMEVHLVTRSELLHSARSPIYDRRLLHSAEPITAIERKPWGQERPTNTAKNCTEHSADPTVARYKTSRSRLIRQPPLKDSTEVGAPAASKIGNAKTRALHDDSHQTSQQFSRRKREDIGPNKQQVQSESLEFEIPVRYNMAPSTTDSDGTWETIFSLESLTNSDVSSVRSRPTDGMRHYVDGADLKSQLYRGHLDRFEGKQPTYSDSMPSHEIRSPLPPATRAEPRARERRPSAMDDPSGPTVGRVAPRLPMIQEKRCLDASTPGKPNAGKNTADPLATYGPTHKSTRRQQEIRIRPLDLDLSDARGRRSERVPPGLRSPSLPVLLSGDAEVPLSRSLRQNRDIDVRARSLNRVKLLPLQSRKDACSSDKQELIRKWASMVFDHKLMSESQSDNKVNIESHMTSSARDTQEQELSHESSPITNHKLCEELERMSDDNCISRSDKSLLQSVTYIPSISTRRKIHSDPRASS